MLLKSKVVTTLYILSILGLQEILLVDSVKVHCYSTSNMLYQLLHQGENVEYCNICTYLYTVNSHKIVCFSGNGIQNMMPNHQWANTLLQDLHQLKLGRYVMHCLIGDVCMYFCYSGVSALLYCTSVGKH